MAKVNSWRALQLGEDLPRLLVKTRSDQGGYDIQLTDLSRIWGEKLGKNEVVERAGGIGCSIDPSEDDQYEILLDKIGSALRNDSGTKLEFHSQAEGHELQLDVSAPLPGSLPTFTWTINLVRMPDQSVGTDLVTPLLAQATQQRHQMQQLIDELASKDRVIAKITDRLETSGNDLTAVFPGVSNIKTSRKKSQRAQLANHVKGLADFDESVWRASLVQDPEAVNLSADVLNSVLEGLSTSQNPDDGDVATVAWWTELSKAGSKRQASQVKSRASSARPASQRLNGTTGNHHSSTADDSIVDDFQRQGTPPQLKKQQASQVDKGHEDGSTAESPSKPTPDQMEDAETEDEDDLDAVPSGASSSQTKGRSQQQDGFSSSTNVPSAAPQKLGAFGGKKAKSPQPEPEPEPAAEAETEDDEPPPAPKSNPRGRIGAFGGNKAKDPEPAQEDPPEDAANEVEISPPKPRTKLGAFGGKSKATTSSAEPMDVEHQETRPKSKLGTFGGRSKGPGEQAAVKPEVEDHDPPSAPVKGKLGSMGGKHQSKEEPKSERQPRAPEKTEQEEEQVREDSQERADKKRERLKRELEEKSKAPAKKKRKF